MRNRRGEERDERLCVEGVCHFLKRRIVSYAVISVMGFSARWFGKRGGIAAVCAEERDRSVILQGSSVTIFGWFRGNFCMTTAQKSRLVLAQGKASNDREREGGAREEENQCPSK